MDTTANNETPKRRLEDHQPTETINWGAPGAPAVPADNLPSRDAPLRAVASMAVDADGISVYPTPAAKDLEPGHYMLWAPGGQPQGAAAIVLAYEGMVQLLRRDHERGITHPHHAHLCELCKRGGAGSAQPQAPAASSTIDTPAFRDLLRDIGAKPMQHLDAYELVIAHVDRLVAGGAQPQAAAASGSVRPWQERATDTTPAHEYPDLMRAEIADLRAQLNDAVVSSGLAALAQEQAEGHLAQADARIEELETQLAHQSASPSERDMLIAEAVRNECLSAAHEADPKHEIRRVDLAAVLAKVPRLARQQAAPSPTDISKRLRALADSSPDDGASALPLMLGVMRQAADEIERYYGGMMAWKRTAEAKDREFAESRAAAPTQAAPADKFERMFLAACADLGLINEALGLDPDDGGADPILGAIAELKEQAAPAVPEGAIAVTRATLEMIYAAMNHMGDVLNGMDAVEKDDEDKCTPAFDAIRNLLAAAPASPTPPTARGLDQAKAELHNLTRVERLGDQSVGITFASARACSSFIGSVGGEFGKFATPTPPTGQPYPLIVPGAGEYVTDARTIEYLNRVRDQALGEAAGACDTLEAYHKETKRHVLATVAEKCAHAIRALKSAPTEGAAE